MSAREEHWSLAPGNFPDKKMMRVLAVGRQAWETTIMAR